MKTLFIFFIYLLGCDKAEETPYVAPVEQKNPVQILMTKNIENAYPRWSVDGSRILFQSNRTRNWQIFVMDKDGLNEQRITNDTVNNNFPDWSPDNSKIVFVSDRDGNEEIYIMNSDGSGIQRLTDHSARDIHPYFSPDGTQIFFNSLRDDGTHFDIYRMNTDGTGLVRLTQTEEEETCARLSPDGSKILYLVNLLNGNDEVYTINSDGTQPVNISKSGAPEGWPAWSPDGNTIIFSSERGAATPGNYDSFSIYLMNPDGSNVSRITYPESPYMDTRPSFSPDGKYIVFNRQTRSAGGRNTIGIFVKPM